MQTFLQECKAEADKLGDQYISLRTFFTRICKQQRIYQHLLKLFLKNIILHLFAITAHMNTLRKGKP